MNFDLDQILSLKAQLEKTGYANDEQCFGSFVFEHRRKEIIADLRQIGYTQKIDHRGGYFPEAGALYWFYDPDVMTAEKALEMTLTWIKNQNYDG